MTDWFRVNVGEDDIEIIHHDPPTPMCDVKHMLEDVVVDTASVERMVKEGKARYCRHCFSE